MYPLNIDQLLTLKRTTRPCVRTTTPTVGYATEEFHYSISNNAVIQIAWMLVVAN